MELNSVYTHEGFRNFSEVFSSPSVAPSVNHARVVENMESEMLELQQCDVPLTHRFAPGVYVREVCMPAGALIIGHQHNTEHFNIVLSGRAVVMMDGVIKRISAPDMFKSDPGVRKVLFIEEEMRWATIHPTEETDLLKLEEILITKSDAFLLHQSMLDAKRLQEEMKGDQST